MLTPKRRGWPGWSPLSRTAPGGEEKSGGADKAAGGSGGGAVEGPPRNSLEENGGIVVPREEPETWRRFREAGSLDPESIERKDRAALVGQVNKLEAELYDYQYNMGLLLIERKEWTSKYDQVKHAFAEAEENLKREQAAHLVAISEAEKREESLKRALGVEKQCVADLENALHEMRAEIAEVKFTSDNKMAQAREMIASSEEKSLAAESKLHAAEALQAETSRKLAETERKLQEIEGIECALQRDRQSFKSECDAREAQVFLERQNLLDWEKKLQEGQERLLEGQRLLNQREEYTNQRDEALKQIEKELEDARKHIESDHATLKEKEADISVRLAALATREENAVKREIIIDKKEQELLVLQEKLTSRENEGIQKLIDEHKAIHEARKNEFEAELEQTKIVVEKELEKKQTAVASMEADIIRREEKLNKREQQLEKKSEKLKEKEKEVDSRLKALKEREKTCKNEEKKVEVEKNQLERERGEINNEKEELQKIKITLEEEKQQALNEQEHLKVTEKERNDLLRLQTQLKEEIENYRARKQEVEKEAEELRLQRENFEKEWEFLDEKREQVRKESAQVDDERKKTSKWLLDEQDRLKQEKSTLRERIQSETEALRLEKEAFEASMQHERSEWLENIRNEQADLVRDIELQRSELENSIEKRREEIEKLLKEKEIGFQKEREREMQHINAQRDLASKEMEEMRLERHRLEKERQELSISREHAERQWSEIKKDIEELQVQREKLKEQRDSLHKEREEVLRLLEHLHKLKTEISVTDDVLNLTGNKGGSNSPRTGDVPSISKEALTQNIFGTPAGPSLKFNAEPSSGRLFESDSGTPNRLSWLQRCASRFFSQSPSPQKMDDSTDRKGETAVRPAEETEAVGAESERGNREIVVGLEIERAFLADANDYDAADQDKNEKMHELDVPKLGPSVYFDHSLPSSSNGNGRKSSDRSKIKVFKRTRSMKAVVEDARGVLEVSSDKEMNESDKGQALEQNEAVVTDNREKGESAGREKTPSGQEIDGSNRESPATDKRPSKSGRKRRRGQSSRATSEQDAEDSEIQSEPAIGGRRKRRQQSAANGGSSGVGTPGAKRYNFRHSTIASSVATQAQSVDAKDKDNAPAEEDKNKNSHASPSSKVIVNTEETSLDESAMVPSGQESDKHNPTVETVDNGLENACEDLQEVSSHELTKSGTDVYPQSEEDEGEEDEGGNGEETQYTEERDDEDGDFDDDEDGDFDDDDPPSLRKKLWKFLTT